MTTEVNQRLGLDPWPYWVVVQCVVYAVIMVSIWLGTRTGIVWYLTADDVYRYEEAKRQRDIDGMCTWAGVAAMAHQTAGDQGSYRKWREIERKDCED